MKSTHSEFGSPESVAGAALIAGCGYLGSRLAARWVRRGRAVSAITRDLARAGEFELSGFRPVVLDLSKDLPPVDLPTVDTVLWAVGFDRTAGVSRQQIWIDGLTRLADRLSQGSSPRRFIYISSTSVYGDAGGDEITESTEPAPVTEGGLCCLQAEQHLRSLMSTRSTEVIILRMAGIYGPDRLLRRKADLTARVPLSGPADDWLNLIHVDDAAAMIDWVSTADAVPSLINVVNTGTLTRREYYSLLAELIGAPEPVFTDAEQSGNRGRSGNKRVQSEVRSALGVKFLYDDVRAGLRNSVHH